MNTSIEAEYWVVDERGALDAPGELVDIGDYAEKEFVDPLFEIKTSPCRTFDELRGEFLSRLQTVLEAARAADKRLVPLGTPLCAEEIAPPTGGRAAIQRRLIGAEFENAKHCAGTHVHFERDETVRQLNLLTALDPAFALVNTASHYQGERVAACARPHIYRQRCYRSQPDAGQLWEYVDCVDDWNRRLDDNFDALRRAAVESGIDGTYFDAHFEPENAVWTPVRLRTKFPTVEWRSPDTALPSQILRLVESIRDLVKRTTDAPVTVGEPGVTEDEIRIPPFETVRTHVDAAIRDGLSSAAVSEYLGRMGFTAADYQPIAPRLSSRGDIPRSTARAIRLDSAARLERDIERLSTRVNVTA
ncbi:glutamate-cysteine ligase family protein (plasmid) [Haloferacaceae archaeon DSL9]